MPGGSTRVPIIRTLLTSHIPHSTMRYMRSTAPGLLPIFRSDAQAKILAWLLLHPGTEMPIAQLVPIAGVTQSNVHREVTRLLAAGLLREHRAGNTRMVSANPDNPYHAALVQLLGRAYGPAQAVPAELAHLENIQRIYLTGSWARRFHGELGPAPNDVDVIVVGTPQRRLLNRANARLEALLDTQVQITVVSPTDWEHPTTGFLTETKSRPLVDVTPTATTDEEMPA